MSAFTGRPCPKCGHVRTEAETVPDWQCPKCGVAYAKALQRVAEAGRVAGPPPKAPSKVDGGAAVFDWLGSKFADTSFRFTAPDTEILEFNEQRLVIKGSEAHLVFDRARRVVVNQGAVLAGFDDIQSVSIGTRSTGENTMCWTVTLKLGWFKQITVGWVNEEIDASVLAARVSTATGRPVSA